MSQAKHTPGPWDYYLEPSDHYKHKIRSKPGLICQLPGWVIHDELRLEQEANARLIAAAPTMYSYIETKALNGDDEAKQILETIHASR